MSVEKVKRNQEFIRLWKKSGLTKKELGAHFGLKISGVKSLKQRLRQKYPELCVKSSEAVSETKRQVGKSTGIQVDKETNRQAKKKRKVSFYFTPALVQRIKIEAVKRSVSASELVEGWLSEVIE